MAVNQSVSWADLLTNMRVCCGVALDWGLGAFVGAREWQDDFHDLDDGVVKVNVHQSGIRVTPPREH